MLLSVLHWVHQECLAEDKGEKWAWVCVDTLCYHWNQTRDEIL
jgi:hypothetical protein